MSLKALKNNLLSLRKFKSHFELLLERTLEEKKPDHQQQLWEVTRYALLSGGKRVRPILCQLVGKSLGNTESLNHASLCVEYFHTASLIADDMPFMDDDDFRRDMPSTHKKFGQAKALLASYALISWGYEAVNEAAKAFERAQGADKGAQSLYLAISRVSELAGMNGAVSGQYLDLFKKPETVQDLKEIMYKKTVTLFSLAFELGWIFGGGDLGEIAGVQQVAYHFGLFFQMVDDYQDREQDTDGCNTFHLLGEAEAKAEILVHREGFFQGIKKLGIETPEFTSIIRYIEERSQIIL